MFYYALTLFDTAPLPRNILLPQRTLRIRKEGQWFSAVYPLFSGLAFAMAESDTAWNLVKDSYALFNPVMLVGKDAAFLEVVIKAGSTIPLINLHADPSQNYKIIFEDCSPVKPFESSISMINIRKNRLRLNIPFMGRSWEIDFSYDSGSQDFNAIKDNLRKAGYILDSSGHAKPEVKAFAQVVPPAGMSWEDVWFHEFGLAMEGRDFTGRLVMKNAYRDNSAYAWDLSLIAPGFKETTIDNLEIEHSETIRERRGRETFWLGRKRYMASLLSRPDKAERCLAPYPYLQNKKKYCITIINDLG